MEEKKINAPSLVKCIFCEEEKPRDQVEPLLEAFGFPVSKNSRSIDDYLIKNSVYSRNGKEIDQNCYICKECKNSKSFWQKLQSDNNF